MAFILVTTLMQVMVSLTPVTASTAMTEMFQHSGACNTQHGKEEDDPDYYTTNSNITHLPSASGFMGTHGTYRHLTVHEQTAVLIGEGKHGMWRIQGAGFIRVYRTQEEEGIKQEDKDNALDGDDEELNNILVKHYTHQDGSENRDHKHSFGEEISKDGFLNWLDLTIYHPKFGGKYKDHPVMDLPWYYCGLSGADYPHMGNVWKYVKAQKNANRVGPLGKRAGMDVNENFNAILRMEMFGGGGVYTNVGQGNPQTDLMQKTLEELKSRAQTVHYKRIDDSRIDTEFYILERGYHNYPESYLIIGMVMDSKVNPADYSYVRPAGRYYDGIYDQFKEADILNTEPNFAPPVYVKDGGGAEKIYGMAIFGHNHPTRQKYGLNGGACPTKGGDCSTYPWGNSGAGWPTDYEEITPICDGIVLDIKLWADLEKSWESETIGLGNSGYGTQEVEYSAHVNHYGKFQDPWLVDQGIQNPQEVDFTEDGNIVQKAPDNVDDIPVVAFTIDFGQKGDQLEFEEVNLDPLLKGCAAEEKEKEKLKQCSGLPVQWEHVTTYPSSFPVPLGEVMTVNCWGTNFNFTGDSKITCKGGTDFEFKKQPKCEAVPHCEEDKVRDELKEVQEEMEKLIEQLEQSTCPSDSTWRVPSDVTGKKITRNLLKTLKEAGDNDSLKYLRSWKGVKMTNSLARYIECFQTTAA